ncbi:MAG: alpha/beta hydrolase fold protein [Acidimicrobiia bacterium]|nr:alpha/beta hydrolase fold protein [Acidimicrobiia bacterium]
MELASTDGVTIALHDLGGSGPPLLICHATGLCGRAYEPMAAELTDQFHVWAIDFRGHGDATVPVNGRFDWLGFTDDLEVAVAALGNEPLLAFGHSMGGAVLTLLEQRHPGTLRAAYLFEPVVMADQQPVTVVSPDGNTMSQIARRRRSTFASKPDAMFRYASRPPFNTLRADALAAYVEHGMSTQPDGRAMLKCAPESEAATFDGENKPTFAIAGALSTPITVGYGSPKSGEVLAVLGERLVGRLRKGTGDAQPLLGHFGPLENPTVIARAVIGALAP